MKERRKKEEKKERKRKEETRNKKQETRKEKKEERKERKRKEGRWRGDDGVKKVVEKYFRGKILKVVWFMKMDDKR